MLYPIGKQRVLDSCFRSTICEEGYAMKLGDTRISIGGVYRCCLATVGHEYSKDENIEIGAKSSCKHCGSKFILKEKKVNCINQEYPCWEEDQG